MEEFAASEKYRKYLIEIKIAGQTYYSVWGADMADDETNKVLLHEGKLVIFSSLDDIHTKVAQYAHVFNDAENLSVWLATEDLAIAYSDNDLDILTSYSASDVTNRDKSIELLNTVNLLQDLFYQIDEQNMPLFYQEVSDLKDFLITMNISNAMQNV